MAGVLDLFNLDGRAAIVTGGAKGIGLAYSEALAEAGANVVVADIDGAAVELEAARLEAGHPSRILPAEVDVADRTSIAAMMQQVDERWGRLDVLVNNAAMFTAIPARSSPWQIPADEWDGVLAVNLRGIYDCVDAARPLFAKAGGGHVVNISSGTALHGMAPNAHYAASKGAVLTLTKTLARFLGPENVKVNALVPGYTASSSVIEQHRERGTTPPSETELKAVGINRILGRTEEPNDLVGALIFLSSPASDFMTGQAVVVDGGNVLH